MSGLADILTERIEIPVGNGAPMGAYVARLTGTALRPGVIVAHELFGVSAHVRDACERLAALGYVAIAPDLFHRTAPGVELAHDEAGRERGFELLEQMTRGEVLRDVRAAMEHLRAGGGPRVGIVGLSLGGHVAYLAATVVLYGGWIPSTDIPLSRPEPTLSRTPGITGRILVLVGEHDHVVPPEHRRGIARALRAAGVRHELVEYPGAQHGFLCNRRASYDPVCAEDAWRRIQELLGEELGSSA